MSDSPRFRLFADTAALPAGQEKTPLLYPFWGAEPPRGDYLLENNRFDRYSRSANDTFELTSLEESEAALLPYNWEAVVDLHKRHPEFTPDQVKDTVEDLRQTAQSLAARSAAAGKKMIVFFVHDNDRLGVPIDNTIVFRPSIDAERRQPNEYALPGWQADYIETYRNGELPVRDYAQKPTVSYCGYDNVHKNRLRDRVKHALGSRPIFNRAARAAGVDLIRHPGSRIRAQALYVLGHNRRVQTNFLIRSAFWNGAVSRHNLNVDLAKQSRQEYVDNLLSGDYVLAARGTGNYSFRFYEALSCGRIPVFINTRCILPFDQWINWNDYCVWVEEDDIAQVADRVADFHSQLTPARFRDLQRACRQLWLEWLSPQGFFAHLHRYFRG